ncbi:MAG: metallophosphoesterase family protein [Opitutales bacterium]
MLPTEDRIAIFSDVHANIHALQAVLEDAFLMDVERFICLGDIVGYGAYPAECLDTIRNLDCPVVQGNHDWMTAVEIPTDALMTGAVAGVLYSKQVLKPDQIEYLGNLPRVLEVDYITISHASLSKDEDWGYIFSTVAAEEHMSHQRTWLSFMGHTHVPVAYSLTDQDIGETFLSYDNVIEASLIDGLQLDCRLTTTINVGSVGQPRDGDPRAAYIIYSPSQRVALLRRVIYDIQSAQKAILDTELPLFSAQRLEIGE